jgi:hypothetical protein
MGWLMGLEPTTTGITNARAALNPNKIKMLSNRFLMLCPNQKDKPKIILPFPEKITT